MYYVLCMYNNILSQVCAGLWPTHNCFLEIAFVCDVSMLVRLCICVFVCPPPRLLITSGVIWCDMEPL